MTLLALALAMDAAFAQAPFVPPPENCVEVVKSYLSSSEYNGTEAEDRILNACKDVDTKCVRALGDSLSSSERSEAAQFLPLVRMCAGKGKGDCYLQILDRTPSFDRSTAAQAQKVLKKCE